MNTPDPAEEPPVDVAGLRKAFGARLAVADFTLRLGRGEIFGAVGANGGGKTTALRLLAGLLPADAGGGRVLGVDLRAHPTRLRASVGYMTQHYSLYRDLTVAENLLARARIYSLPDPRRRVAELMEQYGLNTYAHERVGRLSGGWMRRAQFAATLIPDPPLLLLDEPTAGLDLETARRLWEAVVALAAGGTTVLVSTHDLAEAGRCHQVGVFVEGRVVAQGVAEAVVAGSGVRVERVPAGDVDPAALRAALPGLAAVRSGARHHDLIFYGEPAPKSLAWLRERAMPPQTREPTLEDAMSVFIRRSAYDELP